MSDTEKIKEKSKKVNIELTKKVTHDLDELVLDDSEMSLEHLKGTLTAQDLWELKNNVIISKSHGDLPSTETDKDEISNEDAEYRKLKFGKSEGNISKRKSFAFEWLQKQNEVTPLSTPIDLTHSDNNLNESMSEKKYTGLSTFKNLKNLLAKNKLWAEAMVTADANFFKRLSLQQIPKLLWIGCADSRVAANQIVSLQPGEIFVHRNIANVVLNSDVNCLAVLQYAIEVLKVEHIMVICIYLLKLRTICKVVGHYGCGGVQYSMNSCLDLSVIDIWLRTLRDLYDDHKESFESLKTQEEKRDLLCELNVSNSVLAVCRSSIAQKAWKQGQKFS
ncbi:hypothetical protein HK099_007919, partial [Clydaea vesicula]